MFGAERKMDERVEQQKNKKEQISSLECRWSDLVRETGLVTVLIRYRVRSD